MKEWAQSVMATPKRVAMPIMTHPGIEMTGHTVLEAVTDGQVHYQAIQALHDRYPAAASTVIMDLTVEAEAFGCQILFAEEDVPTVVGRLVGDAASIEALQVPSLDAGRVPHYLLANKLAAQHISDVPVFAGCIGTFSLAGRLYDLTELMMGMYIDPDSVRALLDKCTQFITRYCLALKETGVNGVVIAEPAAGLLPDGDCREFSSVYIRRIVEAVQDDDFMVILHNCGNTGHCTGAMTATGAMGYHFGNRMEDMRQPLAECPADVLVMGNLDPVGMFKMATPAEMYAATARLLAEAGGYRNFVLSSGCDTPPGVPEANIEAFYQALADYNLKLA